MGNYMFKMFSYSLLLTLVLELPIGCLLGLRGRKHLILMGLVNVLTNPSAVLVCWLGAPQLPVEIAVIAVEAAVYGWFLKDKWKMSRVMLLSILCNGVSWTLGSWIGGLL